MLPYVSENMRAETNKKHSWLWITYMCELFYRVFVGLQRLKSSGVVPDHALGTWKRVLPPSFLDYLRQTRNLRTPLPHKNAAAASNPAPIIAAAGVATGPTAVLVAPANWEPALAMTLLKLDAAAPDAVDCAVVALATRVLSDDPAVLVSVWVTCPAVASFAG
jgi:hypothetical protein